MSERREKVVYFARRADDTGLIKIGFSSLVGHRMYCLSLRDGCPVKVLATTTGDMKLEYRLHRCLSRSHSNNEWFHPTDEVLTLISALNSGVPLHEAIDLNVSYGAIKKPRGPNKVRNSNYESGAAA